MKLIITIVFAVLYFNCNAQGLKNTEWVQAFVESKERDKNNNMLQPGAQSLKYFFLDSTVLFGSNDQYRDELKYSFNDSLLKIGNFMSYKVDTLTDQFLIATEIPKKGNKSPVTVTFLNTDYLFDYIKKTGQLKVIGDSLIIATTLFSPAFKGEIDSLLITKYDGIEINKTFKGYFIVSRNGDIRDIEFQSNKYKKKDIDAILSVFTATKGSWILPPTPKSYDFRVSFAVTVNSYGGGYVTYLLLNKD